MSASPAVRAKFDFRKVLDDAGMDLKPGALETLQANITKLCNQACTHCHVDSSPRRRETMSDEVIDGCFKILAHPGVKNFDVTGGAPELHPKFKEIVTRAVDLDKRVIIRHNLTVTLDPHPRTKESMAYLPKFFAEKGVELISSLPCYQESNTNSQRGDGVFEKSIESLRLLNKEGYGVPESGLVLNLIYNPTGAFLPAPQAKLEQDFRRELADNYGISFNNLFALTNMPIHRFKAHLVREKSYEEYMEKLVQAFNPSAAKGVMCRNLVSVSFDGKLYDCDFNQMLNMTIGEQEKPMTVFDFDMNRFLARDIRVAEHCFGCTAGSGSSCVGNTVAAS